jgi:hypothetical protein
MERLVWIILHFSFFINLQCCNNENWFIKKSLDDIDHPDRYYSRDYPDIQHYFQECLPYQYISDINVQIEPLLGHDIDDTGLNGISILCSSSDGSTTPIILAVYENFGDWGGCKFPYKKSDMFWRGISVKHYKPTYSMLDKMGATGLSTKFCTFKT